jgi:hypothetical protein
MFVSSDSYNILLSLRIGIKEPHIVKRALLVLLITSVTFSFIPAFMSNVFTSESLDVLWHVLLFMPMGYAFFDAGELIGKAISWFLHPVEWNWLVAFIAIGRIGILTALLYCNFYSPPIIISLLPDPFPNAKREIRSDSKYFVLIGLFGLTAGYARGGCSAFSHSSPQGHSSPLHTPLVGQTSSNGNIAEDLIIYAAFDLGAFVGSMTSFFIRYVFCSCNPFPGPPIVDMSLIPTNTLSGNLQDAQRLIAFFEPILKNSTGHCSYNASCKEQ